MNENVSGYFFSEHSVYCHWNIQQPHNSTFIGPVEPEQITIR